MLVLSRKQAMAAVAGGYLITGTGKRDALARMAVGDRVVVYSPRTDHPDGEPLRAVTAAGQVTGAEPVEVQPDVFQRAAELTAIEPVPLADIRAHVPVPVLRFGCIVLNAERGDPLWAIVSKGMSKPAPRAKRARRKGAVPASVLGVECSATGPAPKQNAAPVPEAKAKATVPKAKATVP